MDPKQTSTSGKTDSELKWSMNKRDMLGWEVGGGQLGHQSCRVRMGILLASIHVRVGPVGPTNRLKSQHYREEIPK